MKLIVYSPSYKDNPERNENYIKIFARNSGLPRRRRSKPSMRPITTPTKEKDFDRHREQHIGEPMHLEDDERTGQERWLAAITSPDLGCLAPQTTTPARRTTGTRRGSKPPEEVGQATNPAPWIGKTRSPALSHKRRRRRNLTTPLSAMLDRSE